MTPEAITLLFKEATEAFTLIDGKPTDAGLFAIRETLLLLLMDTPYDHLGASILSQVSSLRLQRTLPSMATSRS